MRRAHGDHLGSISVASNGSGALASQQEFDPWGTVRSGSMGQTTLNYTGQRLDGSGLLDYHARMYNPVIGRFVSADTIAPGLGNPQARNRYSYVINNPLRYTDPTGHCISKAKDMEEQNERCRTAAAELGTLGVVVDYILDWQVFELEWVLEAVHDLMNAAGCQGRRTFDPHRRGKLTHPRRSTVPTPILTFRFTSSHHSCAISTTPGRDVLP